MCLIDLDVISFQLDIGHHLEDAASFISSVITKVKVENLQSLDLKNIRPLEAIWRQYKSLDTKGIVI